MHHIIRFFLFTALFFMGTGSLYLQHTPVINIFGSGGESLSEEAIEALRMARSLNADRSSTWHDKRLCFTQDRFLKSIGTDSLLTGYTENKGDIFTIQLPSIAALKERKSAHFFAWERAHLLAAFSDASQTNLNEFEQSSEWKKIRSDLIFRAANRHAIQDAYDHCIDVLGMRCQELGIDDEAKVIGFINQKVLDKQQEDLGEFLLEDRDSRRIAYQGEVNPSVPRKTIGFFDRTLFTPWRKFYRRHQDTIDAVSRGLLIVSAVAFIFNKLGGTEWIKNKIREAFDKPTVYEVQRRTKRWFGGSNQSDLVREDDLILSPSVRKQVSELIYLIRRRYELRKQNKKRFSLPLLMLHGPPGTGKTTIAQMIADQTIGDNGKPMNFIKLVASDFMQIKNEGDRVAVLKKMFKQARSMGNTVIFLDEIDGMVRQRGQGDELVNRAFLDHLLDEIAKPSPDFMVIAATNHINRVDGALLSRFRRKIEVKLPTTRQRHAIISRYAQRMLRKHQYHVSFDMQSVAELMQGVSGRDIETFFMRMRDRLDFIAANEANEVVVAQILREMGVLPPLPEDEAAETDLEDRVMWEVN